MINNRLIKKSGIYFIGNLSSKIMSAIIIPIYAFYITAEDLGVYDFSQTVMGILSPIILMAIWEAVLKLILSEENSSIKEKIISTSAIFSFSMSLLFILISLIYYRFFGSNIEYFFMIISMIVLHSIVNVWQYYARATINNKLYVVAGIASTFINFAGVLVFVVFFQLGLLGLFLSYNIGQISIIMIIELKLKVIKNINFQSFDKVLLKRMIMFSAPLVLNLISAWFISGFGRTIITMKLGTEANGLYSFANKFSLIITMLGSVITMAIIEEAIISIKSNYLNKDFNKTLQKLFSIFQTLAILAVPMIVIFYELIANTDYFNSLIFAPWLLIYAVANTMASNIGSVFQAIDKTKYQFTTTIIGGLSTFLISFLFIDEIGISAVILGQILGAIAMLVSRYILINRFVEMKLDWKPILLMFVIFVLITLLCLKTHFIVSVIIESILLLIVLYRSRLVIIEVLNKLKKRR